MADAGTLRVQIVADIGRLQAGLQQASEQIRSTMSGALDASNALARGVGVAFAAAGAAIIAAGSQAVKVLAEEERLLAQTTAAIKSTGGAAQVTARHIVDLSNSMEDLTTMDNAVIQSAANMLLTFTNIRNEAGKNNDIFDQTVKAAANMAAALGTDAKSAAMQLGKALNDPIEGMAKLTRSGVTFTEAQKSMVKQLQESGDMMGAQKIILAELEKEFGGSAEAIRGTFSGSLTNLMNKLEDLNKAVFAGAMPVMQEMIEGVAEAIANLTTAVTDGGLMGGIDYLFGPEMKVAIAAIAGAITASLIPAAQAAAVSLYGMATAALAAMAPLAPFAIAGAALGAVALVIAANWRELASFFGQVWAGAVGYAQTVIQQFTDWCRNTFNSIAQFVSSTMRSVADFFGRAWAGAVEAGGNSLSRFVAFAGVVVDALGTGFQNGLNGIISMFGRFGAVIANWLGEFASDWVRGLEIMGLGDWVADWKSGLNTIIGNLRSLKSTFVSVAKAAVSVPTFGGGDKGVNIPGGAGGSSGGGGKSGGGSGAASAAKKGVDDLAEAIKRLNKSGEELRTKEAALGDQFAKNTEWANFYGSAVNTLIQAGAKASDAALKHAVAGKAHYDQQVALNRIIDEAKVKYTQLSEVKPTPSVDASGISAGLADAKGAYVDFMGVTDHMKEKLGLSWGEVASAATAMAGQFIGSLEDMGAVSTEQADYIMDALDGIASAAVSFAKFAASGFTDLGSAISGAITLMKTLHDFTQKATRDVADWMTGGAVKDNELIVKVYEDTRKELDAIARKKSVFGADFDDNAAAVEVYEDAINQLLERFDASDAALQPYLAHYQTLKVLMEHTKAPAEELKKTEQGIKDAGEEAKATTVEVKSFGDTTAKAAKTASSTMSTAAASIGSSSESIKVELSEAEQAALKLVDALGEISKRQLIYGDDPLELKIKAMQDYLSSLDAGTREFIDKNKELQDLIFQSTQAKANSERNKSLFESAKQMASGLTSVITEAINGATFAFDTFSRNLHDALKGAISGAISGILQQQIVMKQLQPLLLEFSKAVEKNDLTGAKGLIGGIFAKGQAIAATLQPIISEMRDVFSLGQPALMSATGSGDGANAITININGSISSKQDAANAGQEIVRQLLSAGVINRY